MVSAVGFVLIGVTRLLRGYPLEEAALYSALWAAIASVMFVGARIYDLRRGRRCQMCGESPESTGASATLTRREGR